MITVYAIIERSQRCDGDGWAHWIEETPIKYFQIREDAEKYFLSVFEFIHLTEDFNGHGGENIERFYIKDIICE